MLLCGSFILLGVHQLLSIHQFLNGELSWCEFDSMPACQKGKNLQGHDCGTSSDAFSIKFKEESHSLIHLWHLACCTLTKWSVIIFTRAPSLSSCSWHSEAHCTGAMLYILQKLFEVGSFIMACHKPQYDWVVSHPLHTRNCQQRGFLVLNQTNQNPASMDSTWACFCLIWAQVPCEMSKRFLYKVFQQECAAKMKHTKKKQQSTKAASSVASASSFLFSWPEKKNTNLCSSCSCKPEDKRWGPLPWPPRHREVRSHQCPRFHPQ